MLPDSFCCPVDTSLITTLAFGKRVLFACAPTNVAPDTVKLLKVPTLVKLLETTPLANEVPVNALPATVTVAQLTVVLPSVVKYLPLLPARLGNVAIEPQLKFPLPSVVKYFPLLPDCVGNGKSA